MNDPINSVVYLIVLILLFAAIVIWAYGKKRKRRFEQDAKIPFQDDQ